MRFTKASVNQSFIWINPLGEGNKKKLQQHVVYHSLQSSSLSQRCRANYSKKPSLDSLIIIITIMARKAVRSPFEDKTTVCLQIFFRVSTRQPNIDVIIARQSSRFDEAWQEQAGAITTPLKRAQTRLQQVGVYGWTPCWTPAPPS